MIRELKSKKLIYALILSMTFSTPLTAYASSGEDVGFYEKMKTFIFGEEETNKDQALTEFRRQFNAGNNNMSQVLNNATTYNNQSTGQDTQELAYEELDECGSAELEGLIPYGPYDVSTVTDVVHQNYGFGEGQTRETTIRVNVKQSEDASTGYAATGATLVGQGEHSNIWVVNPDEYYSDSAAEFTMTADNLYVDGNIVGTDAITARIAANADVIYEKMTTISPHAGVIVGTEYSYMPEIGDTDNDGRYNVVLYQIGLGSVAGYFYLMDYYNNYGAAPMDAVHIDINIVRSSAINSETGDLSDERYSTLAHEFQHLLFYMYFSAYINDRSSYTWVNEGLSGIGNLYYSDYTTSNAPDPQNFITSRVKNGTLNSYTSGSSYGDFVNWSGASKNYGITFMMSAMLEERQGGYINRAYDYFKTNLVEATDPNYAYDRALTAESYANKSMTQIWGEVFRNALGDSVDTTNLSSLEVFEYVYVMFMESYMSAGGQIIDGDVVTVTDEIWRNGGSLWSYRNGNRYYTSTTDAEWGNDPYTTINSGGNITLVGYPSNSTSIEATHEMAYTLDKTDFDVDSTNILNIKIPKTENMRAYVALYDTETANPAYKTVGSLVVAIHNDNYDPVLDTADLYPIELGVDNYVTVDSDTIVPHLFVFTFYNDVNTTVSYDWIDTITDIEPIATMELLEDTYYFNNTARTPSVEVTLKETGEILTEGLDYEVIYSDNINAGEATATVEGIGKYKGSISANFEILITSIVNATIYGITNGYSYTGLPITPQFVVYLNGHFLQKDVDFTYTFTDNVDITKKAYLTIEGINNYNESIGAFYEIY